MPSDPDFLNLFRHETTIVKLAPGQALFREGETADCMYVVRSGTVRVSTGTTVLEELGPGSILGEMALIEDSPRSATVTAVSECEIAGVDRHRFLFLVQQTPSFALNVMKVLSHRLREMNRRYRY
jgi:CRP/FNR family transcriptional regulator, cyclic AMP receptor protein